MPSLHKKAYRDLLQKLIKLHEGIANSKLAKRDLLRTQVNTFKMKEKQSHKCTLDSRNCSMNLCALERKSPTKSCLEIEKRRRRVPHILHHLHYHHLVSKSDEESQATHVVDKACKQNKNLEKETKERSRSYAKPKRKRRRGL